MKIYKTKMKIYKTKPKGAGDFTPTHYSIPQGKDKKGHNRPWKERKLKIGDKYDIITDEPGEEVYIKGIFVGWKKSVITLFDGKILPGNISYHALFKAEGNIEVVTDYCLTITKAEEKE